MVKLCCFKVCGRCVQRLLGQTATDVAKALATALDEKAAEELCPACLGILQHIPSVGADGADESVEARQLERSRPGTWAASSTLDAIAEVACSNGHQIDEWLLNVQVLVIVACQRMIVPQIVRSPVRRWCCLLQAPGVLALSTAALWRRLQKEYPEASHFQGTGILQEAVTVKDVASAYVGDVLNTKIQAKKGTVRGSTHHCQDPLSGNGACHSWS